MVFKRRQVSRPPAADEADDLKAIRQAVDDAAAVSAGLWLTYLFTLFYFAIAAGAVTHVDLLLERPVKLPFLGVDLPLVAFFFLAPILFVMAHAYTLVHFVLLGKKAVRFHEALRDQIDEEKREGLRRLLPSNIFVQFLAGPSDVRGAGLGRLLKTIAWFTLVFGPIALLLLLQIQFLPYHHRGVTWTHRLAVAADLVLIWWLWRKVLGGRSDLRGWRAVRTWAKTAVAGALSAFVILLSWTVATFPGEWADNHQLLPWRLVPTRWAKPTETFWPVLRQSLRSKILQGSAKSAETGDPPGKLTSAAQFEESCRKRTEPRGSPADLGAWFASTTCPVEGLCRDERTPEGTPADLVAWFASACPVSMHDGLLAGKVDDTTRRRTSLFSNTLVLPGFNVYEVLGVEGPTKVDWREHLLSLRGRDLKGAVFDLAVMPKTDAIGAHLEGASLNFAQLRGATLNIAQLQGASLNGAWLQGASLDEAELHGARLDEAEIQGASLFEAQLQGASLAGGSYPVAIKRLPWSRGS
jgi:hypothetical protein